MSDVDVLRLGTRGSLLARMQSGLVADQLVRAHPGVSVELVILKTTGDVVVDRPLHDIGGKGLFTKELEQALLDRRIDFAVHSFKDVPVTMPLVDPSGLVIAAVPAREDPRDVLVTAAAAAKTIDELPRGARVGTGSLRRRCQLLAARSDLNVEMVRGNIDTRVRKLRAGEFDAIVLAMAGLTRAGLMDAALMTPIDPAVLLPAPGQGALALQCRREDETTRSRLAALNHRETELSVQTERALVLALAGDCHSPIAAAARIDRGRVTLSAAVGARDGATPVVRAQAEGSVEEAGNTVRIVHEMLARQGAEGLLAGRASGGD